MTLSPPGPLLAQTVQTLALPDENDDGLHFAVLPNCNTTSRKSRVPSEADFRLEASSFSPIGRSGSEMLREKNKSQVRQSHLLHIYVESIGIWTFKSGGDPVLGNLEHAGGGAEEGLFGKIYY